MIGTIIQVDVSGVGLIDDETHVKHPFTFDSVKGYFGQPMVEAGLLRGKRVSFSRDDRGVNFVEIVKDP